MKMLKTKHFRRLAVFLAMIAPAVYLFGSLFSALSGAHGTEVFAEPVYVDKYVSVDDCTGEFEHYRFTLNDSSAMDYLSGNPRNVAFNFDIVFNGNSYGGFDVTRWDVYWYYRLLLPTTNLVSYDTSTQSFSYSYSLPWVFYFDYSLQSAAFYDFLSGYGSLEALASVPSDVVVDSPGAYSDYVFKNFFAKDNFLVEWGRDAISATPHGFAPFGAFWRYLDVNVLHLSDQQIGLMGYGYLYYACHVLLFDVGFVLVTFFLDFIQRIADKFTGGE